MNLFGYLQKLKIKPLSTKLEYNIAHLGELSGLPLPFKKIEKPEREHEEIIKNLMH